MSPMSHGHVQVSLPGALLLLSDFLLVLFLVFTNDQSCYPVLIFILMQPPCLNTRLQKYLCLRFSSDLLVKFTIPYGHHTFRNSSFIV